MNLLFISGILQVTLIVLGIVLYLVLPAIAVIDIAKGKFEDINKIVWILIVLLLPIMGPIIYLIVGRRQKLKQEY